MMMEKRNGHITKRDLNDHGYSIYECLCDCGQEIDVSVGALMQSKCYSCGCLQKNEKSV